MHSKVADTLPSAEGMHKFDDFVATELDDALDTTCACAGSPAQEVASTTNFVCDSWATSARSNCSEPSELLKIYAITNRSVPSQRLHDFK